MRSMFRALAVIASLTACSFQSSATGSTDTSPDAPGTPGTPDAPPDMTSPNCFGTGLDVRFCLTAPPAVDLHVMSDSSIDTDGPMCAPGISKFCVIARTKVEIEQGNTLGASGSRPLVVVSTSDLVIDGVLDVASHINTPQHAGPGADSMLCHDGTPAGIHGGGWGGSFGTKGGNGGAVNGANAGTTLSPTTLQGGCKGSDGAGNPGKLGHGGGAVYLIATSISVTGSIKASGESGASTVNDGAGGGGGGSGGMIVFDTPMLSVAPAAQIFANGGGGGEGTGGNTGKDGTDALNPSAGGVGGSGGSSGGDGGAGGFGTTNGGGGAVGGDATQGGGGGGGGAGVIKVFRATAPSQGMVSPPIS
jgi:hypothetical protein